MEYLTSFVVTVKVPDVPTKTVDLFKVLDKLEGLDERLREVADEWLASHEVEAGEVKVDWKC